MTGDKFHDQVHSGSPCGPCVHVIEQTTYCAACILQERVYSCTRFAEIFSPVLSVCLQYLSAPMQCDEVWPQQVISLQTLVHVNANAT